MPGDPSSLRMFASFAAGSESAADRIFQRYVKRLSRLARTRLTPRVAARVDPEDIVMSAWRSFFVGSRQNQFDVDRSGDLWALLARITLLKLYQWNDTRHRNGPSIRKLRWLLTTGNSASATIVSPLRKKQLLCQTTSNISCRA